MTSEQMSNHRFLQPLRTLAVIFTILLMKKEHKQSKSVRLNTVEKNKRLIFTIAKNKFELFFQFRNNIMKFTTWILSCVRVEQSDTVIRETMFMTMVQTEKKELENASKVHF
jgi:hypothetical protein